jgi:outer membrane protein assembly factor BamB
MQRFQFLLILAILTTGAGADWLRFRGDSTNTAVGEPPPIRWNTETAENVPWTATLAGRGTSSPIVVRGNVIVTASSGPRDARLHVLCFDSASGERRWERRFWATGRTLHHPMTAVATNTPASDGERIYALYSSNDLVCLDLDGDLQWFRGLAYDFPAAGNDAGMSSSPAISGETVIVQIESQGDSFAAGLDKRTGEDRWRIKRAPLPNWSSPVVTRDANGREIVLLQSAEKLSAHDPATGDELWTHASKNDGITSSVVNGEMVFLPTAGAGVRALQLAGGAVNPRVVWTQNKLNFGAASPVLAGGRIYTINRAGVLNCGRASDGAVLWQLRLKGAFWSTPLVANGHLYAANQDGEVHVVRLPAGDSAGPKAAGDTKGEVIASNAFGESLLASPAAADGALYYRSEKHLWKITAKQ